MNKKITALVLAAVMALSCTACGGSSASSAAASSAAESTEETVSSSASEGGAVQWLDEEQKTEEAEAYLENVFNEWTPEDGGDYPDISLSEDGAVIDGETFTLLVTDCEPGDGLGIYLVPAEDGTGYVLFMMSMGDSYKLYVTGASFKGGFASEMDADFNNIEYVSSSDAAANAEDEYKTTLERDGADFVDENGLCVRAYKFEGDQQGCYIGIRYDAFDHDTVSIIDFFVMIDASSNTLDEVNAEDDATIDAVLDYCLGEGAAAALGDAVTFEAYELNGFIPMHYIITIQKDNPDWCTAADTYLPNLSLAGDNSDFNMGVMTAYYGVRGTIVSPDLLYPEGSLTPKSDLIGE